VIEVLTGAFSGVGCALFTAALSCAVSKGKRFDFWILIVGALVGIVAALLGASYFTWQEWFLTVVVLALFEYGGKAVTARVAPSIKRRIGKDNVLLGAFIVGSVVFVEWWIIAFFMWFYPLVGNTFMFTEFNAERVEVFHWFATFMPQIERDLITYYLIIATPTFYFLVTSPFAFVISDLRRKLKEGDA
jgi:hypothetical protein